MRGKVNQQLKNTLIAMNDQQEESFYKDFYIKIGNTALPDMITNRLKEMILSGDDTAKIISQLAAFSLARFHIRVGDDIDAAAKDAI